jgi:hypothetical protein
MLPLKQLPAVAVRLAPSSTLDLDPAGVLTAAIGLVRKLRHDAFKALLVGCGEKLSLDAPPTTG